MAWFKKRKQKFAADIQLNPAPEQENEELIAVLAAAVAAYLGTEPGQIVVRSWRQVNPAWKRSAREMQVFHRF